ncbi:MAG: single-stranded-DNA-specific exonuclease RecJ [Micavibrio aeruginosavorus]|uniref:Single-stranded-DNA-specific exonuclease RecJ n=1 Tax=Micavibrio aeruginosavorus TaxID=349221 RepID=A0A7T5UGS0_9BACT|nr:MAG: single-stranded-DNA-specific exonuclease RecJ [Micavibrio aeruginosavorus]
MTQTVLQVENSLMQARWVTPRISADMIEQIARRHELPEIVARLIAGRNIPLDRIESFLDPKLSRDFPDPFTLQGMTVLAEDLAQAIIDGRKIAVFGDFDVDGATSTAILVRFLRHCGVDARFYIPDRLKEGYGPNIRALSKLRSEGADICILADCGTTAHDVVEQAAATGLEVVILDHHEAEETLPLARHLINPKRKDDTSGLNMLAACGVSFLTCVAINTRLREKGFYKNRAEAPLKNWLDLVALGTVCDMVPLTGPNRLFVRAGFAQMAKRENIGIDALCRVAKLTDEPNVYHAGFVLGPRINAGSRVHQADLGARLLLTEDPEEARNIAWTLNDCNEKRKDIQSEMFAEAVNQVEDRGYADDPVIIVDDESWHPGLAGLVASRLKEKYSRPAVVITYAPGAESALEGRGSGRSVPGVNIAAAFIDARQAGLLVKGGGHAMAGGFTLLPGQKEPFRAFMREHISRQLQGQPCVSESVVDAVLSVRGAQYSFVQMLQNRFGPFGAGHEEPVFALPGVRLHSVDIVGEDHIRCMVSDWEGGSRMKAMAFRAVDTPLGQALLKKGAAPVHLLGHFKLDTWNGAERVEMHILDAALVGQADERLAI